MATLCLANLGLDLLGPVSIFQSIVSVLICQTGWTEEERE